MKKVKVEEGKDFYGLWLPLLRWVDAKRNGETKERKNPQMDLMDKERARQAAKAIWEDDSLIDAYLSESEGLSEKDREEMAAFKRRRTARFILERHMSDGAVLIDEEGQEAFVVKGINASLEELTHYERTPFRVWMTILPFRGQIVTDGFLEGIETCQDRAQDYALFFQKAKTEGKVFFSL